MSFNLFSSFSQKKRDYSEQKLTNTRQQFVIQREREREKIKFAIYKRLHKSLLLLLCHIMLKWAWLKTEFMHRINHDCLWFWFFLKNKTKFKSSSSKKNKFFFYLNHDSHFSLFLLCYCFKAFKFAIFVIETRSRTKRI